MIIQSNLKKFKEKLKEYKLTKYFGSKANIKFKEKKLSYDYTLLAGITTSLCAKRIWIKGEVFETSQYSKKFKASNCYIKERNGYYQIEEIVKVDKQVKFICKILVVKKISMFISKVVSSEFTTIINTDSQILKLVPVVVKENVYLSERPNRLFNE